MSRFLQVILVVSVTLASWLGMQAVHELGHVLGAWATGARVAKVVLHPLAISRTDLTVNPRPLLVVWAGPVVGVVLPLAAWALAAALRMPGSYLLRFFAGFCLIANGAYIAIGSFDRVGDCEQMLAHGSSPWQLWLFGAVTVPVGLWLWHGQGAHFGLGRSGKPVAPSAAYASLAALALLLLLGLLVGGE